MAYFPNGTSAEIYEAEYCRRCLHHRGADGRSMCPIMMLHMIYNYDLCNQPDNWLDELIPRTADRVDNEQCTLFVAGDAPDPNQLDLGLDGG